MVAILLAAPIAIILIVLVDYVVRLRLRAREELFVSDSKVVENDAVEESEPIEANPSVTFPSFWLRLVAASVGFGLFFYETKGLNLSILLTIMGSLAFALVGWGAGYAWGWDVKTLRIPSVGSWFAFLSASLFVFLGAMVSAAPFWSANMASYVVALVLITFIMLLVALATRGALGSADVRLMIAFTPIAWWVGYTPLVIGLFLGSVIQIPIHFYFRQRAKKTGVEFHGAPFAPALIVGVVLGIQFFGNVWIPCQEWVGILYCSPH